MLRTIRVVPYDPSWQAAFAAERELLAPLFADLDPVIHHIGSTAVPGLAAKPIIDVLIEVREIAAVDRLDSAMRAAGYTPMGEYGIPGRRFFLHGPGPDEERTAHVHVFAKGSPDAERHLAFRDYLIARPDEAKAYGALKRELARRHPHDIEAYMAGKEALIRELQRRALLRKRGARE
ncbi:MAG: GrpB family protein [Candidatus Eisenbacteria bacterium]|nr:GrpB family protein [Candidatus Eisenbacteria bacterium]